MKKKRGKASAICDILCAILLLLVIVVCVPITLPRLAGYQAYTVVSGSMEPAIPIGSLVYIHQTDPAELEVGDVAAFYSATEEGVMITHRVTRNQVVSGRIITKGDANAQEDMEPIDYDQVVGKVELSVPVVGGLLATAATSSGRIAIVCVIFLALALHVMAGVLQKTEKRR